MEPEPCKSKIFGERCREAVLTVIKKVRGIADPLARTALNEIDEDTILEHEAAMEGLNLERQILGTPDGPIGLVADLSILIKAEFCQEIGETAVILHKRLFG